MRPNRWAPAALALVLGACASPGQMADEAVKANRAQEQMHNEMLLLNVVRAVHRRPMHFTKVTAIRATAGWPASDFKVPMPFGPDFTTQIYDAGATVKLSQPGIDIAPLDSQEFMLGIMSPVEPALFAYYVDQGWPRQLLLHMFVEAIEIRRESRGGDTKPADRLLRRIVNQPLGEEFAAAAAGLARCEFESVPVESPAYGPPLTREQLSVVKDLAAARTAGLMLRPAEGAPRDGARQEFFVPRAGVLVRVVSPDPSAGCTMPGPAQDPRWAGAMFLSAERMVEHGRSVGRASPETRRDDVKQLREAAAGSLPGEPAELDYALLKLRSPQGMLYFLGELARKHIEAGRCGVADELPQHTFKLHCGDPVDPHALSVRYEDRIYHLRGGLGKDDHSMQMLTLVSQLLQMQNKATTSPITGSVRVVP